MADFNGGRVIVMLIIQNMNGILSRISNVCSENNISVEKLTMSNFKSHNHNGRKAVMVANCGKEKITKLLTDLKNTDVILKFHIFENGNYIERELLLVKIKENNSRLPKLMEIVNSYNGSNIYDGANTDKKSNSIIFQFAGESERLDEIMLKIETSVGDVEISKSGMVASSLDSNMDN